MYGHMLKNSLLFLYKFKFSEAYISLNIDLGSIKVISFLDFVDQIETSLADVLPPARCVWYIIYPLNKKCAYKANFCEMYGYMLKNSLLFLYRLKFSEVLCLT